MRLLLVDDHQLLCVALSEHLERIASQLVSQPISVTPAFTLADAVAVIHANDPPDLVFLDLNLDGDNRGPATLRRLQEGNLRNIPVIIFTGLAVADSAAVDTLRECLGELGARGILLKGTDLETTFIGLARLLHGEQWIPQEVLMALATTSTRVPSTDYHLGLSPREWAVARCLTRGLRDKEIARDLNLSPLYVRQVTTQIYHKLNVRTRTEAATRLLTGRD